MDLIESFDLQLKINKTTDFIHQCLIRYKNPAIMCSFGKDSMVMLHLMIEDMGLDLPVIFFRDPFFPWKYKFADDMIQQYELEVYNWTPQAVSLWEGKSIMAFTNHLSFGRSVLDLPKNIIEPDDNYFKCGIEILNQPKGTFQTPWDLTFVGHKNCDEDQIAGKIPLKCDIKQNGELAPDVAFPLRDWSNADIWAYTKRFKVDQQPDRYDVENECEFEDKTTNSDYANVCIRCLDRRNKAPAVFCPKHKIEVTNISHMVNYHEPKHNYFGEDVNNQG